MVAYRMWNRYSAFLSSHPMTTQIVSGFLIACVGDYVAQCCIEKKNYDSKRGVVVGSYGGLEIGFEAKLWLPLLDKVFGSHMTKANAVKKLICEQIVYTPTETACFMKWTNSLEHRSEDFHEKMSRDYILVLLSNLGYWIPISFINYYLIPIQYRALYIACTTFIIDTFTSFASHNNLKEAYSHLFYRN